MEEVKLTEFGSTILMTVCFLGFLVFMTIKNIRNNIGFWNKYGMILLTVMYTIFIVMFIYIHPPKIIPTFEIGIGSVFYIAICALLTDFDLF
jgi:hypothetical protein